MIFTSNIRKYSVIIYTGLQNKKILLYFNIMIKEHPYLKDLLVDSDGSVFIPQHGTRTGHWTKGCDNGHGYLRIKFNYKMYFVHRLIAETFIPNPQNKPYIDHIDRIRNNNCVSNLRWCTRQENNNNTSRNLADGKRRENFESYNEYCKTRYNEKLETIPGYKEQVKEKQRQYYLKDREHIIKRTKLNYLKRKKKER